MEPILTQMVNGKDFQTASARNIICEINEKEGCYVFFSESIFGGWNFHVAQVEKNPYPYRFPVHFYKSDEKVMDVLREMYHLSMLGKESNKVIVRVNTILYARYREKMKAAEEQSLILQLELF